MKALANIKNLKCEKGKNTILRNLSRIMDICVIDIDVENGMLNFLYIDSMGLNNVKQEMARIGFPIQSFTAPTSPPLRSEQDSMYTTTF